MRRRLRHISREALRGLGARGSGRQDDRGGPADPRRAPATDPRAPGRPGGELTSSYVVRGPLSSFLSGAANHIANPDAAMAGTTTHRTTDSPQDGNTP